MEYTKVSVTVKPLNEIANDLLMAQMGELGYESFSESDLGFDAYIPSNLYEADKLKTLELPFENTTLGFSSEVIADQNWNKVWEDNFFQPIVIGNECCVRSPFHKIEENTKYEILIEPKMAFGTGHHATTSLMIQHILECKFKNTQVLDMGCGTGILGILCSMRGAESVLGIDIDEWAYNNAYDNIHLNNVNNMTIKIGDAALIEKERFDIILTNINRNILLNDIKNYANSLNTGGQLFLSGFYSEDLDLINEECKKNRLEYISQKMENNWVAAAYKLAE